MTNKNDKTQEKKRGFFGKLMEKLDNKFEEQSKKSSCCGGSHHEKDKGSSCC